MKNGFTLCVLVSTLCLFLSGCAGTTQKQERYIASVPSSTSQQSTSSPPASLDPSLPPTGRIDRRGLSLLEVIFRTQLNINRIDDLYATTRGKVGNMAIISSGELNVLKAFIAQRWAPVVLLQYGNKRHLWAVMGYDNPAQQIQLGNPINSGVRIMPYADFEKEWAAGSAQKCALVTPIRLSEARVHEILAKYLPTAQASQVKVRSR